MQNTLRNKWTWILVGMILAASVLAFAPRTFAQPSSINVQSNPLAATTSQMYVPTGVATAATTYQFDSYPTYSSSKVFSMAGIDSEYLYVLAEASTTSTVFGFTPQYSNNGIDWYNLGSQGTASAQGSITTASTTIFTWQPNTTSTTSLSFKLPDMTGMHQRVQVTTTGANGSVHLEVVLKKNTQGQ